MNENLPPVSNTSAHAFDQAPAPAYTTPSVAPHTRNDVEPVGRGPIGVSDTTSLSETLAFGTFAVRAEISGMRPLPAEPPVVGPVWWTVSPDHVPSQATAPVCVGAGVGAGAGARAHGTVFIDLALAPGVVTVTGPLEARTRVAAAFANQICARIVAGARRLALVVTGEAAPADLLEFGPRRIASAVDFDENVLAAEVDVCFLLCRLTAAADAAHIDELTRGTRRRIVPIVVDDVYPAAWSFGVEPSLPQP